MFNLNRVTLLGNVTHDPDIRSTKNGKPMALLSVATSRRHKNQDGEYVSEPTYHRLICWGTMADVAQRLTKGAPLFAEGRIQHSTWKDKDGVEKMSSEIIVDQLILLAPGGPKKAAA